MGCGIEGVLTLYGMSKAARLGPWLPGTVAHAAGIASSYGRYSILDPRVFDRQDRACVDRTSRCEAFLRRRIPSRFARGVQMGALKKAATRTGRWDILSGLIGDLVAAKSGFFSECEEQLAWIRLGLVDHPFYRVVAGCYSLHSRCRANRGYTRVLTCISVEWTWLHKLDAVSLDIL